MPRANWDSYGFESRIALRSLLANWRISGVIVLTLALGIALAGASTLVFRFVVLQPLPFGNSRELHVIERVKPAGRSGLTPFEIGRLSEEGVLAGAGGYRSERMTLGMEEPVRINVARVTPSLPGMLGLQMLAGTTFDGTRPDVAMLDEGLWRTAFGGEPSILGRSLVLDGQRFYVVGVVRSGAALEERPFQIWIPAGREAGQGITFFKGIGRLPTELSVAEAQRRISSSLGVSEDDRIVLTPVHRVVVGSARELSILLLAGSFGVLAASCAVVVLFLLLHLTTGRQLHGLVVRRVLGASKLLVAIRLLALLVCLVLPACALALGALLTFLKATVWGGELTRSTASIAGDVLSILTVVGVGIAAMAFCLLHVLLYIIATPLEGAVSRGGVTALPDRAWVRGLFLASVVAVTMALGISALVGQASVSRLYARPLGFTHENRMAAIIPQPARRTPESNKAFWASLLRDLQNDRRIKSVGLISTLPMYGGSSMFFLPTESGDEIGLETITASPGLFETLDLQIVAGRGFRVDDDASVAPVALVNETAARVLFGGVEGALGEVLTLFPRVTIVGVTADHLSRTSQQSARPVVWLPYLQQETVGDALVLYQEGMSIRELEIVIRSEVGRLDSARAVEMIALGEAIDAPLKRPRIAVGVLSIFATALVIFCVAVTAGNTMLLVRRRSRETAVRVAHGATLRDLLIEHMRSVMVPIVAGIAVGVVGALLLLDVLRAFFADLGPLDHVLAVVSSVAVLASALSVACASAYMNSRKIPVWRELSGT